MAERLTAIFADQIADLALGDGLKKASDDTKMQVRVETDGAIGFDGTNKGLEVLVDNSTIELYSNAIQVKDGGITEPKLDINNAAVTGYFLKWNGTKFEWADIDSGAVMDDDVIVNEIPTGTIGSGNVNFAIANTPVAGTVALYLNGLFQAPGSGNDYTISGKNIVFSKAPRANSEIYACYIKA